MMSDEDTEQEEGSQTAEGDEQSKPLQQPPIEYGDKDSEDVIDDEDEGSPSA